MARKQGNLAAMRKRATRTVAASTTAAATPATTNAAAAAPKRSWNIGKLATQVRAEARKITWTSRQETWITSVMVFLMVAITSVFFFVADWALSFGVAQILKLAVPA